MMSVLSVLNPLLPVDTLPLLVEIIYEIERMPDLQNWSPHECNFQVLSKVISLGFPLFCLKSCESVDVYRRKISRAIRADSNLHFSEIAELEAGALCAALGGVIQFVKPVRIRRTPDLKVRWSQGVSSDIEVVSGCAKAEQISRIRMSNYIIENVKLSRLDFDIIIHCSTQVTDDMATDIIAHASGIKFGEVINNEGKFEIKTKLVDRKPNTIWVAGQRDGLPSWWETGVVTSLGFKSTVGTKEEKIAKPQVRIINALPINSYLNPVLRKANRSQQQDSVFIIAFDVSRLPRAFDELSTGLKSYFEQWDHVAGVLAFRPIRHMTMGQIGWERRYYSNEKCIFKSPKEMMALENAKHGAVDMLYFLREKNLEDYLRKQEEFNKKQQG